MNSDLSLSRALGGLRIANPDDASPSPHEHQTDSDLSVPTQPIANGQSSSSDLPTRQSRTQTAESSTPSSAGFQADTQNQLYAYAQNGQLPYSSSPTRPVSGMYRQPSAAGRDQAANSYHKLRTEPSRTASYNASSKSDTTRVAPDYLSSAPSRESSHRDRSYNPGPQLPATADVPGTQGSEEWKDRGAAVGMRREVDASGKTVMKQVKKGVRDFSFGRILGEGSYSSVFLATDRQTLKEYAVKVLEKKHIIKERKIKYVNIEKDTLNRLTEHPGIVRLYYTFQDENSLYYVLDLCTGGELLGVLKKTGTFDVECSRFFGAQILDAVEYMHSRGVIHRDLKPENVLLDDQLHVKITDFGTARLLSDPRAPQAPPRIEDTGTSSGSKGQQDDSRAASFVGTAEYVSPELLTNKNACKASDLWAFGCIIYQLLAGRPPFKAGSEYLTFQKIVNLDYDFPAGFPPAARDLVERCLVLDPARRLTIEHIKNHEFFDGQKFGKMLWKTKAPRLRPYVPPSQEPKIIHPHGRGDDGHRKFARFFGGSTTKKRQRLVMITSSGRIVLAPAGGEEKKAKQEISLLTPDCSWKTQIDAKGQTIWSVDSGGYHYTFEEAKAPSSLDPPRLTPEDWLDCLQQAKDFALSMNLSGSYMSDNGFGDMSSSMSSPASTFGPDNYGISDRSHRSSHLSRSQANFEGSHIQHSNLAFIWPSSASPVFDFPCVLNPIARYAPAFCRSWGPGIPDTMQPFRPYPQQPMPQHAPHPQAQRRRAGGGQGGIGLMMSSTGPQQQYHIPTNPQMLAAQQQQAAMALDSARRRSRKPTDKNLPDNVDDCVIGDTAERYRELRDFERRLDATMTRKRLDIVDSVNRSAKRWKTLRIWITNTAEDQVWQGNGINVDTFDFSSNLEPTYRVKIEGRLLGEEDGLDTDDQSEKGQEKVEDPDRMDEDGASNAKPKAPKPPKYRLSHFFKALNVDFPANRNGVDQSVEWKKPERIGGSASLPAAADFDELTFKRSGDENLNITINFFRHEEPERFAVSPELEDVIDMREATRQEILMGVWEYIKLMGLQEDEEKRRFRCDDLLRTAFRQEVGEIPRLHEYITSHLRPIAPVRLPYTIRLDEEFHKNPQPTVYDVRVPVDDPLREKMTSFLTNAGYANMLKEAALLDEQLATIVQALHVSKAKHAFLTSLGEDPATFVRNWLSSQKRDFEVIRGEAVAGAADVTGDEWRKGGKDSVWATVNARESVNVLLSKPPTQLQRG
ncbi:putative 3-phosphoinositide dependent protein kinase-1 [Xylariaceae sp. FL0804]|nr:putative 3-phosphoinositide dependent protein kinase-1 [Xylariaceae sp. FL0804]